MEGLARDLQSKRVASVVFDFDGTISTLRSGWEMVMKPLMVEKLMECPLSTDLQGTEREVEAYIDESTGIQTIFQMKWLADRVTARGGKAEDAWEYKDEYNRRLMESVEEKKRRLLAGEEKPEGYLIAGAMDFLRALKARGVRIYVASGTDHPDVVAEAKALGVYDLFDEVAGAPVRKESCSKEAVLRRLIGDYGLHGDQVAVIGDGKVEIRLAIEAGALAIGLASDEEKRFGMNPVKYARLTKAGAKLLFGDFMQQTALLQAMGLEG